MDVPNLPPGGGMPPPPKYNLATSGQPLSASGSDGPERLLFDFKGIPAGYIDGPLRFGIADAQPQMSFMYVQRNSMQRRLRIRREYPGLYPELEDEFQLALDLYTIFQQAYTQSQNPIFFFFIAYTVFGEAFNALNWMRAAMAQNLSIGTNPKLPFADNLVFGKNNYMSVYQYLCLEDQPLTMEARTFYQTVLKYVENFYTQRGFTWHYFMAVKDSDPRVQAHFGKVPITPEIFETYASDLEHSAEQIAHLKKGGSIVHWTNKNFRPVAPFTGWSRKFLLEAIKTSGLWDPDVQRLVPGGIGKSGEMRTCGKIRKPWRGEPGYQGYPQTITVHGGLLRLALGIPVPLIGLPHLPGLVKPTSSTAYYETIYRMLFNTLSYVNWETVCNYPRITTNFLRQMAKDSFDIPVSATAKMPREELCTFLTQQGRARQEFSQTLREHLPFQTGAVKFQPGSRWIQSQTRMTQAQMGEIQITHPYERMVFVQALCEDSTIGSLTVARKARQVGMGDLLDRVSDIENVKKSDLCEFLLERLTADAERFGFIIVDCRNPSISKRHIIQTIREMELGGIFRNVDVEKATKAEICAIVESYIQVFMENRALTLAK
jgi:hypothetical protein